MHARLQNKVTNISLYSGIAVHYKTPPNITEYTQTIKNLQKDKSTFIL